MAIVGMMVAAGVVYSVANGVLTQDQPEQSVAAAKGTVSEEFLRLNTADLEHPASAAPAAAVTRQEPVDPFIHMNTTALDALIPATASEKSSGIVSEEFLKWNVDSLNYQPAATVGAVIEPRADFDAFIHMNTTALDGLAPASAGEQSSGIVTEEFLKLNISSLEYAPARYSESASGPR